MRYTKQQISEAIQYWYYVDFFNKKRHSLSRSVNMGIFDHIDDFLSESSRVYNVNCHDVCIFNPFSLSNIIRSKDYNTIFINEIEKQTAPTAELEQVISKWLKHISNKSPWIVQSFDEHFNLLKYDPDQDNKIFGNVLLDEFPFDVTDHDLDYYVGILSRKAYLLGYNIVDLREDRTFDRDGRRFQIATIQFEASYFSSNLKTNDFVYHVTTRSIAHKVISRKTGLVPSNKNSYSFGYPPRVYCFIDNADYVKRYAAVSDKRSLKFIAKRDVAEQLKDIYDILQAKSQGFQLTLMSSAY